MVRRIAVISLVGVLCSAATTTTGSIAGTLVSDTGAPIRGAKITVNATAPVKSQSQGPAVTGLLQGSAVTAADGSFSVTKLAAGTYTICAQAGLAAQIDPCHWSQTPPQATISAGQNLSGIKISLKKGAIFNVRIDDPKHYLNAPSSVAGIPHISLGVYTPSGQYYPAYLTGKDATGSNYSLTIPQNTTLRFAISSKHVKLQDSKGNAVPANGLTYAFRYDSGVDNSAAVEFLVTGTN
jgi:hypothetical protein